jgi:predicted RNA-binding protein with PIN domain
MPYLKGSLEEKRRQLILKLNHIAKEQGLCFTLVFDASKDKDRPCFRSHYDEIEIIYATAAPTADEYIIQHVEGTKKPSSLCVVSSDKGLIAQVRALGTETLSLQDFVKFLEKKHRKRQSVSFEAKDSPKEIERLRKIFEEKLK